MALEALDDSLIRVLFHKPSKFNPSGTPFLIAHTLGGVTVKGEMRKPVLGQAYRFWGEWVKDERRGETQFSFSSFEALIDRTDDGVAIYLMRHVPTLGHTLSRRIVEAWGVEALSILREQPGRLRELEGFSDRIIDAVKRHFEQDDGTDPAAYARLIDLFGDVKIPRRVVQTLLKDFGSSAYDLVIENPYRLLDFPRVGWGTVDPFALAKCGYDERGLMRQAAAIGEAFTALSLEGHTFATRNLIDKAVYNDLIGYRPSDDAWAALLAADKIVSDSNGTPGPGDAVALKRLDIAERSIAANLVRLMATGGPLDFTITDDGLLPGQRAGVRMIEEFPVCLFTGGPGTGKTFSTTRTLGDFLKHDLSPIAVAAPTGKAAKRAEELLARAEIAPELVPSSTIHRLLGPVPSDAEEGVPDDDAKVGRGRSGFKFAHSSSMPLRLRALMIDETSMVDVSLAASTLEAVPNGCRVVFVGDSNQLPSVGPGSVLRDMIAAGLPCNVLTQIQRSAGRVVRACHEIMAGRAPRPSRDLDLENGENWLHIEVESPAAIADEIVNLHATVSTFDPFWGMQVISPEKRKAAIGCRDLNRRLSALLNPQPHRNLDTAMDDGDDGPELAFRIGDKVIRTKNGLCDALAPYDSNNVDHYRDLSWDGRRFGYEARDWAFEPTPIVNGDMGTVLDIVNDQESGKGAFALVRLILPDRLVKLPMTDHRLEMAYAVTVHKAQGSGFPYVIMPTHESFYPELFSRELLYTAISRTEQVLVTVGKYSAIEAAVKRKTIHKRRTRLAQRIREAMAAREMVTAGAGESQ